jgi:hypothetical protein
MSNRARLLSLMALSVTMYLIIILGVLSLGSRFNLTFGSAGSSGSTRVSLFILIWGSLVCFCLWLVVMYTFFRDSADPLQPISALYAPLIALTGTLAIYTTFLCLQALDILAHDFKPHYRVLYQPEVRLFEQVLLFAVFASLAWLMYMIIRGARWTRERRIGFAVLIFGVTAVFALVAVIITSR